MAFSRMSLKRGDSFLTIGPQFSSVKTGVQMLLDALMPPQCMACGASVGAPGSLCPRCFSDFNFIVPPLCQACGVPLDTFVADDLMCGACIREAPTFQRARAVFLYDDVSRPLILKLKHSDRTDAAVHLARWMARSGADLIQNSDLIIPVPLHRLRLFMRMYNQSSLLAHALGKQAGIPVDAGALKRIKATRSQGGLSRKARRRNVAKAFSGPDRTNIEGKKILLVDDVLTTGVTANACTKALLDAGATSVDVLVLARVSSSHLSAT